MLSQRCVREHVWRGCQGTLGSHLGSVFALLPFQTSGVILTESGSGLTCNYICLRLWEKVRAMSDMKFRDSEVGEKADSNLYIR